MRAVAVIPARWGSTRFPGKSLALISGKPLICWCIEAVQRAERVERVLVATDDERIGAVAVEAGAMAVMTRPDHPSGTDRVAEAAADLEAEIIVNVQGDEPLIDAGLIDNLIAVMQADETWDMATAATALRREEDTTNPNVVKVVFTATGQALYFSRACIPWERDRKQDTPPDLQLYWRHLGIYAYRHSFLERLVRNTPSRLETAEKLEQLRALHIGGRIYVMQCEDEGIGVDCPEDVAYVESIINKSVVE